MSGCEALEWLVSVQNRDLCEIVAHKYHLSEDELRHLVTKGLAKAYRRAKIRRLKEAAYRQLNKVD
jgi:hypothetical protein